jgi:hypothetical protein
LLKKKFLKAPGVVLIIGLIFLWQPVFMNYYGLMEADFLTSNLSYENADLEICPLGPKFSLLLFGITFLYFQLVISLLMELFPGSPVFSFGTDPFPLRC